jgi:hypothetical protein
MKKMLLLVVLSGMLLGTSCPGGTAALTCANNLDATQFGFTLTIPQNFACDQQLPSYLITSPFLAVVLYADSAKSWGLEVVVLEQPTSGQSSDLQSTGTVCDDPATTYTANGIEFAIKHCATTRNGNVTYSYTAAAAVGAGGNLLAIYMSSATDDAAMLTALQSILDTVQLTGA